MQVLETMPLDASGWMMSDVMDQSLLLELVVTGAGDLTIVDTVKMLVFCAYQRQVNKLKLL